MNNVYHNFEKIKAIFLDMDGVLTDGSVLVTSEGDELRTMNIKDGYAITQAVKAGLKIFVISGGHSRGAQYRLKRLGIEEVYMRVANKSEIMDKLMQEYKLERESCAYMGDDVPDVAVLKKAGLKSCPADACAEVIEIADYISPYNGGKGAVRDLLEKIMRAQKIWN